MDKRVHWKSFAENQNTSERQKQFVVSIQKRSIQINTNTAKNASFTLNDVQ